MEELRRLVKLISEGGSKSLAILHQLDEKSLEFQLLNLIKNGEVITDTDAARQLYGKEKLTANYRMLKSRLRRKLLNQLYFFEFPKSDFKPTTIATMECSKLLHETQTLFFANEMDVADKLLDQVIALAKANEINESVVRGLEWKRRIAVINRDKHLVRVYSEELKHYYDLEAKERETEGLYFEAFMELNGAVSARNAFLPHVPVTLERLKQLWDVSKSSRVFDFYFLLSNHYLELKGDYAAIVDAINFAEGLIDKGLLNANYYNYRYSKFIKVYALLRSKQYKSGLNAAQEYLPSFSPDSINWFSFMENYLLLAVYSKQYDLAVQLYDQAMRNETFRKLSEVAKERWEIYRKFLSLLNSELNAAQAKLLATHAINQLRYSVKDKEGFNLSLLILDFLEGLASNKIDYYEIHEERFRKYILKYLRGDAGERARIFLRLLLLILRESFNYKACKSKGKNLYNRLKQLPFPGDAFAEVEVVPYEHLWEFALEQLKYRT